MSVDVPPHAMPRCAVHPDVPAGGTCSRCGAFVCPTCATWMTERLFCPTCAARPEVNYLETFRLTLWGRRDGAAYTVGMGTVLLVCGGIAALVASQWLYALVMLGLVPVGIGFFLGQPWARTALVVAPLAAGAVLSLQDGMRALLLSFVPALLGYGMISHARNLLFFRREVPAKSLHRLWDVRVNNPLARRALGLGVNGLFLPLFAPFAIVCGLVALSRVDSKAQPPIGKGGQAMTAIALGLLSLFLWWRYLLPPLGLWVEALMGV